MMLFNTSNPSSNILKNFPLRFQAHDRWIILEGPELKGDLGRIRLHHALDRRLNPLLRPIHGGKNDSRNPRLGNAGAQQGELRCLPSARVWPQRRHEPPREPRDRDHRYDHDERDEPIVVRDAGRGEPGAEEQRASWACPKIPPSCPQRATRVSGLQHHTSR
jgi:hypothetical protein